MTVDLGRIGIWSRELRYNPDPGARAAAAAELEDLGYQAIFIPDAGGDVLGAVEHLLGLAEQEVQRLRLGVRAAAAEREGGACGDDERRDGDRGSRQRGPSAVRAGVGAC